MIELRKVSKIYKVAKEDFYALRDVDLRVEKGEFLSVCGTSGSGKTTLLNIIGFLDNMSGGTYTFNGRDVSGLKDGARAAIRNKEIGFVLQDFALIDSQTVVYNVMLPLLFSKVPYGQIREKAMKALQSVGLADQAKKKANQLSGGQRQRVAIAREIVNDPSVLLADEPTGQLDSKTSAGVMELIRSLNDGGLTVIVVTHDPNVAAVAKRHLTILDGQIVDDKSDVAQISKV